MGTMYSRAPVTSNRITTSDTAKHQHCIIPLSIASSWARPRACHAGGAGKKGSGADDGIQAWIDAVLQDRTNISQIPTGDDLSARLSEARRSALSHCSMRYCTMMPVARPRHAPTAMDGTNMSVGICAAKRRSSRGLADRQAEGEDGGQVLKHARGHNQRHRPAKVCSTGANHESPHRTHSARPDVPLAAGRALLEELRHQQRPLPPGHRHT